MDFEIRLEQEAPGPAVAAVPQEPPQEATGEAAGCDRAHLQVSPRPSSSRPPPVPFLHPEHSRPLPPPERGEGTEDSVAGKQLLEPPRQAPGPCRSQLGWRKPRQVGWPACLISHSATGAARTSFLHLQLLFLKTALSSQRVAPTRVQSSPGSWSKDSSRPGQRRSRHDRAPFHGRDVPKV